MLKNILLNYDFIDNDYLNAYVNLINLHSTQTNISYTERHHVIPICYYKNRYNCSTRAEAKKIAEADNNNYIVFLSFTEHVYAHYLLYMCTTAKVKFANKCAFFRLIAPVFTDTDLNIRVNQYTNDNKLMHEDLSVVYQYISALRNQIDNDFWSDAEIAILTKYYPVEGYAVYKRLPNRTPATCKQKAIALKLKVKNHYWTSDMLQYLIDNYQKMSIAELATKLNRSYAGVKKQIHNLRKAKVISDENTKRRKNKN